MKNVIGIDIGGTRFRVGLFDQEGRRLQVSEDDTFRAGGRDWMLAQILERSRAFRSRTDFPIEACGISFGGPVAFDAQRVTSIHSPGWDKFPLSDWVRNNMGLPCRVDNDANAGALGEYRFGAGRGTRSLVYVTISTGIGAGLIYEGKILRGRDSLAGEIGHIPVSDSGVVCSCGARGCLEAFCSGAAIAQRGRDWAGRRPEGVARIVELGGGTPEGITAEAVLKAAAEGDLAATQIIREVARWLARGVLTLIRILNPDRLILGGGVAQAGEVLLSPVKEFLDDFSSPSISYGSEVVLAELDTYSPLYGAAALALELS